RLDGACHGVGPREGAAGRLRRLRHEADRAASATREDRASPSSRGPATCGREPPGVTVGDGSNNEREKRAKLADLRQEILAPADAIVGYAEILFEDARRLELSKALPDIERLSAAAAHLQRLVRTLLDPQGPAVSGDRVRHDLRNPLTGIRGYSEML